MLEDILAGLLQRRKSRSQFRSLATVPPGAVDFSSNAYLSLSTNPEIQFEFLSQLQDRCATTCATGAAKAATPLLGSGGSRLLDGNSDLAEALERRIADFHRAPAGLLFNSAFDANIGLFSCVPQPGDVIVYDELIHASVHDGMRLSRAAKTVPFGHNRVRAVESSGNGLEEVLRRLTGSPGGEKFLNGEKNVFIAVEGLYSMDGDVAPLKEIVECVENALPRGNGYIVVDEAHSTGIFGKHGRGLVSQLGLENRIWARIHGFGKAMSCAGGVVLCSATTRQYLINYARSLIYTTSMAFPSLLSIKTTYDFIVGGKSEVLVQHLFSLVNQTHTNLLAISSRRSQPHDILRLSPGIPVSPIIPVFTSHPRSLAGYCQKHGFMVRPIVAPTVPAGSERVRICLHAGNTSDEVDVLCRVVEDWVLGQINVRKEQGSTGVSEKELLEPTRQKDTAETTRVKL